MSETMLRLGVPPHIGQSAGPAAETATTIADAIANDETIHAVCRMCFPVGLLACWPAGLLILIDLDVVEINIGDAVAIQARAAHLVRDRVELLDRPRGRLGIGRRPYFAAHARAAVGELSDAQLHAIPLVGVPCERHAHGHFIR